MRLSSSRERGSSKTNTVARTDLLSSRAWGWVSSDMAASPLAGNGSIVPENPYYKIIINMHFLITLVALLHQQHSSSNPCCQRRSPSPCDKPAKIKKITINSISYPTKQNRYGCCPTPRCPARPGRAGCHARQPTDARTVITTTQPHRCTTSVPNAIGDQHVQTHRTFHRRRPGAARIDGAG